MSNLFLAQSASSNSVPQIGANDAPVLYNPVGSDDPSWDFVCGCGRTFKTLDALALHVKTCKKNAG